MLEVKNSRITNIDGALYDSNGHIVGHAEFDKVQIDTLSFQSLADKVLQILTGDPTFHAEEVNPEYDEDGDDWESDVNENIEVDPIDEYTDLSDVFDMQNDLNDKISKVEQTIIEEGKNNPSEPQNEPSEPSKEGKQE